jgi:hypothetical protein
MSAESETMIVNMALSRIGNTLQISDINTDTSTAGDQARLHYVNARDSLLRSHPWNFAIKRAELSSDATAPSFEYGYAFPLPNDCLKVIRTSWEATGWSNRDEAVRVFWDANSIPYRIERHSSGATALLCNEDSVSIEYVAQVVDTAVFDPMFTDVLVARLAAEFAMPLADNPRLAQQMWDLYARKLSEARVMDAQEGSSREVVDTSPWIQSRI